MILYLSGRVEIVKFLKYWGLSGDGSKVFLSSSCQIRVWLVSTSQIVNTVEFEGLWWMDPLHADGSRIWIRYRNLSTKGWNFELLGSPPILLSDTPLERPYLDFIYGTK